MKIVVTGALGQVGWELERALLPLGDVIVVGRNQWDLSSIDMLRSKIQQTKPDIIVNAAAYTAVDKAEEESDLAHRINAEAPAAMAEELKQWGGFLVHYSTDYVFDGRSDRPYQETDSACSVNVYGKSKRAGECAIQSVGCDHLMLRTSWVYAARAQNFLKSILRLAAERETLSIVSDQIGSPTWARLIAETTGHMLKQSLLERMNNEFSSDIYHLTSAGHTSWFGFAEEIVALARQQTNFNMKVQNILPIPTTAYPLPAQRPQNSCLDVTKLENKFGLKMPSWQQALKCCMNEI